MRKFQWLSCLFVATMFSFGCANAPETVKPADSEAAGSTDTGVESDLGDPAEEAGSVAPEAGSDAAEGIGAPE